MRVLVTAALGSGVGAQIWKALRLVSDSRYTVSIADAGSGLHSVHGSATVLPLPPAGDSDWLGALTQLCIDSDIQAILPGSEAEMRAIAKAPEILASHGIVVIGNSSRLIELCSDKFATGRRLAQLGVNTPNSMLLDGVDFEQSDLSFPLIVKPVMGAGSRDVFIVESRQVLASLTDYLRLAHPGSDFVVQEYVGRADQEFTVGVLHDLHGNYVSAIALKRHLQGGLSTRLSVPNRTGRSDLGSQLVVSSGISQGVIGDFPEVTRQAVLIAQALLSRGPMNIQCRLVDGELCVFEINPRFSGTTSIRALVGFNEPHLLILRHLFGEHIPLARNWGYHAVTRTIVEEVSHVELDQ